MQPCSLQFKAHHTKVSIVQVDSSKPIVAVLSNTMHMPLPFCCLHAAPLLLPAFKSFLKLCSLDRREVGGADQVVDMYEGANRRLW